MDSSPGTYWRSITPAPQVKDPKSRGVSMSGGGVGGKVQLPDYRAGTFMVFKTFDRISYGLVMQSESPIRNYDRVRNP